jgi:uncharacterized protein (DUF2236 family)
MVTGRAELEASLARLRSECDDPRAGIHGPGSAAWHLERDSVIFMGGGRAVLLQLAHPFVAYAIAQHSRTRDDVVGRFRRTFDNVFAMSFGDLDHAFTAARRVHNIHTRITGTIDEDAGAFPRGTTYHANDADSQLWVYATLIDTVVTVTERVKGPLAPALKEAYYRDSWSFARLFAIPDRALPPSWGAFQEYVARMCASNVLTVTAPAREMSGFLFGGALGGAVAAVTSSLLPRRLREDFGLAYGARERIVARGMVAAARAATLVTPQAARDLPAYRDARRRIRGLPPSKLSRWLEQQMQLLAAQVSKPAARSR